LLALIACNEKPNPGVCCTTEEDCARLGGIEPRSCPDGYACRDLLCEVAGCAVAADCSVEQPVCDAATGTCHACTLDTECPSEVCDIDTGRCVAEDDIIYASASGTDAAGCTHQQPCSVMRAVVVASADPSSSLLRLLPGTYSTPIAFTSGTVKIIGTGASLMNTIEHAIDARGSAVVEIRGFDVYGYVSSVGSTSPFPSLTVRDSTIRRGYSALVGSGTLHMIRSSVEPAFTIVDVSDDGTFEADQSHFEGYDTGGYFSMDGRRGRVRITNSIFERVQLSMNNTDVSPDRSEYHISFSTFLFNDPSQMLTCSDPSAHPRTALFENNIFFASSPQVQSVVSGFPCTLAGNITYPQAFPLGGTNIARDPMFVNPQGKDYRLQPGSPAVDAAVPASGPGLDHDFAGTPRPQGARKDIGAFELRQ
jgi:hypothetical protein